MESPADDTSGADELTPHRWTGVRRANTTPYLGPDPKLDWSDPDRQTRLMVALAELDRISSTWTTVGEGYAYGLPEYLRHAAPELGYEYPGIHEHADLIQIRIWFHADGPKPDLETVQRDEENLAHDLDVPAPRDIEPEEWLAVWRQCASTVRAVGITDLYLAVGWETMLNLNSD